LAPLAAFWSPAHSCAEDVIYYYICSGEPAQVACVGQAYLAG
jgi:hypothetical protein